jgi:hypothetical protein
MVCNDKPCRAMMASTSARALADDRVALIDAVVGTETAEHRFDVGPRGVAQHAGDEGL